MSTGTGPHMSTGTGPHMSTGTGPHMSTGTGPHMSTGTGPHMSSSTVENIHKQHPVVAVSSQCHLKKALNLYSANMDRMRNCQD